MPPRARAAVIVACDVQVQTGRLRLFSAILEAAGYEVTVLGSWPLLRHQPKRVASIAVHAVPAEAEAEADPPRRRARIPWVRPGQGPEDLTSSFVEHGELEAEILHLLDGRRGALILALDPLALTFGHAATLRERSRGSDCRLAYDRAHRPSPGSIMDRWERAAIGEVELGTAASLELANDDRWPLPLRARVPTVYSAPLELAGANSLDKRLTRAVMRVSRPRVGVFLPPRVCEPHIKLLRSLVGRLPSCHPVFFGSGEQMRLIVARRPFKRLGASAQRVIDDEDTSHLLPVLDLIVCPSSWAPGLPPSLPAVASRDRGSPFVASQSVVDELGAGHGVEAGSAEAVAEVVHRALTVNSHSPRRVPERAARPKQGTYGRQLKALREHFEARTGTRLGIGPRNGNGQAWAWAMALRRSLPTLSVEVFTANYQSSKIAMSHKSDFFIDMADWQRRQWQLWWAHRLRTQFSHLLIEQGLSICGSLNGIYYFHDLPGLLESGLRVGLVFRGSEIRDPAAHAKREKWSPFRDPEDPLTAKVQVRSNIMRNQLSNFDVPKFVTTLDLLEDVPEATWLPQTLDLDEWSPGPTILERERPVVIHAPSSAMKGSHWVDDVCCALHETGIIEYHRLHLVPFAEMPAWLRRADIVIDQLALGSYGVLALQAMACQRLVIGHVNERVRGYLSDTLPVLQAEPPNLRDVLEETLTAREWARAFARSGREYVRRYHSGEQSAKQLVRQLVNA